MESGLCQCGCGKPTPIATRNRIDHGQVKGQPQRYLRGHSSRYSAYPEAPEGFRWCPHCKEFKPLASFYPNRSKHRKQSTQSACIDCNTAAQRKWRQDNRARHRTYHQKRNLRTIYGMTVADYEARLASQDGACAICRQPESKTQNGLAVLLSVDHDHVTGKVRGLLCNNCNRAIGLLGDGTNLLRRAITYLERHA